MYVSQTTATLQLPPPVPIPSQARLLLTRLRTPLIYEDCVCEDYSCFRFCGKRGKKKKGKAHIVQALDVALSPLLTVRFQISRRLSILDKTGEI